MNRLGFRGRLFLILLSFALIPSVVLSVAWGATTWWALPLVGTTAPWDSVAATGQRAIHALRGVPLDSAQRGALQEHERTLREGVLRARQANYVYRRAPVAVALGVVLAFLALGLAASRVAAHLSRRISRPLQELVGWTALIARAQPIPNLPPRRGAPEFAVLRDRMREMAAEIELGRARALEAGRTAALRESARQVAHELKNPLTPIRFAVARLRRDAPAELAETVEVLAIESQRLEEMAKSFAQFGRLPEGPMAEVDLGEMARHTARAVVPDDTPVTVEVEDGVPMVRGHYDALSRALTNLVLNAVEACRDGGSVTVRVQRPRSNGRDFDLDGSAVEVEVADTGCGIAPDQLARIWEPYVTYRPGGTGLGLAIVRQTILAHHGAVEAESAPGHGTRIRFILPTEHTNGAHA